MCHHDSWSSRSILSSQVGNRVSGWLTHDHVIFGLPLPPFLTLFRSVSLFHTFHPTVADTCLRNASDRCLCRSTSQLHLGHLFNLSQRDAFPHPHVLFCPSFVLFSSSLFRHRLVSLDLHLQDFCVAVLPCLFLSRYSRLFVSPLDSGTLIIFAEQHSSAAISTVPFHHH